MPLQEAAELAVTLWAPDDDITMVAIAGAESGWNAAAEGDPWWIFAEPLRTLAQQLACPTYTSIGYWQINFVANYALVSNFVGSGDGCDITAALKGPVTNALLALRIWQSQGFGAWTVYRTGAYLAYLDQAVAAVLAARAAQPSPVPPGGIEPPTLAIDPSGLAIEPPGLAIEPP